VIKIVLWLCLACNPCQLRVSGVSEPCFVSQPGMLMTLEDFGNLWNLPALSIPDSARVVCV